MKENFFYVAIFNIHHPVIKAYLSKIGFIDFTGSTVDLKVKSRIFKGIDETINLIDNDFYGKIKLLYKTDDPTTIRKLEIQRPDIELDGTSNSFEDIMKLEVLDEEVNNDWQGSCVYSIYFTEDPNPQEDEDIDQIQGFPSNWLVKYEIYYTPESYVLIGNGEQVYNEAIYTSSSVYH